MAYTVIVDGAEGSPQVAFFQFREAMSLHVVVQAGTEFLEEIYREAHSGRSILVRSGTLRYWPPGSVPPSQHIWQF